MTDEPTDKPNCYFRQQLADPPPGGRFAGARPKINGTEPTVTPLAVPEWCIDPTGIEPPLVDSSLVDAFAMGDASVEAEGMAEDVSSLLPSDAMPEGTGEVDVEVGGYSPQPTILGTLCLSPEYKHAAEINARRESFRIVSGEEEGT
jgi:hypothetical protein